MFVIVCDVNLSDLTPCQFFFFLLRIILVIMMWEFQVDACFLLIMRPIIEFQVKLHDWLWICLIKFSILFHLYQFPIPQFRIRFLWTLIFALVRVMTLNHF